MIQRNDQDTQIQIHYADASNNFATEEKSRVNIDGDFYRKDAMPISALAAGDLQGRSLLLGKPTISAKTRTQLDVALGVPPMHVDFIRPLVGDEPAVFNISVFPDDYNASIDFTNSTDKETEREHSVSYGFALTVGVAVKLKTELLGTETTEKFEAAISGTFDRSVKHFHDNVKDADFSLEVATAFDDLIVATTSTVHTYIYPIIGQFVCPDGEQTCDDDDKLQVVAMFSGPDDVTLIEPTGGIGIEWYQPAVEPGNIFSYPGSFGILTTNEQRAFAPDAGAAVPTIKLLTTGSSDVVWSPQDEATQSIEWGDGSEGGRESDWTAQAALSLAGSIKTKEEVNVGLAEESASLTYSADFDTNIAFGGLNTHKHSWKLTNGVILKRGVGPGGNNTLDSIKYQGGSYIYGLNEVDGTIAPDLSTVDEKNPTLEKVKAYAPFKVGFTANMLSQSSEGGIQSGDWWKQVYTEAPDIALNHPQRWLQRTPEGSVPQQVRFNCPIGFDSDLDEPEDDPGSCVANEDEPTTVNVVNTPFYKMKGLFVTPDDNTNGPVIASATLGDTVTLQTRVYNYSLLNMPAGATVHARFFAQPWDSVRGQFENDNGDISTFKQAYYIGERILGEQVPAFCGGSQGFDSCEDETTPNWLQAALQWDTSAISPQPDSDTNWKFWVVVWMQDVNGDLVEEIEGHGLTAIPVDPANAVTPIRSFADIGIETYSNNIGYYNQVFSLLIPVSVQSNTPGVLDGVEQERDLVINKLEIDPALLKKHQHSTLRVHFQASGEHYDGASVFLYEGDSTERRLLDVDIVPRISKDEPTVVAFPYLPETCGAHSLFVEVSEDGSNDPVTESISFDVPCEPLAITKFKGKAKVSGKHGNGYGNKHGNKQNKDRVQLSGRFELKRNNSLPGIDLATSAGQVTLHSLLKEVGGNGELVKDIPIVLHAGYRNTENSAIYQTDSGVRPVVTLTIKKRKKHPGSYSFKLKLKKANIETAGTCPRPELLTSFTIDDGGTMPVHVVTDAEWKCQGKSGNMKTQ